MYLFINRRPCFFVQLIFLNRMYVLMMFISLSATISVNCIEFPLRDIWSNMSQVVVSYKTAKSFCSDVVAQLAYVIKET